MDLIIAIACIGAFIYFLYLIAGYLDAREAERVQRERHELHSAFIEKMMEKENHGISPV